MIILHVDMDAFYASIEMRDNPALRNVPLIIGAKPSERGVVSTCNYEARKYGVRSGMNIKEAYALCPDGTYLHPDFRKYHAVSNQLHEIWSSYSEKIEYIAFDEAYLDLTGKVYSYNEVRDLAYDLKKRVLAETGLTCSVGIGYSKSAAKLSSEEKKPNGFFTILSPKEFVELTSDRDVRILPGIGAKTEEKLNAMNIFKVKDIRRNDDLVKQRFGKHGEWMVGLSNGVDGREVTPYSVSDMKSMSREVTFQTDVINKEFLREVLFLLSMAVYDRAERLKFTFSGVSIKITYFDMKKVTRQRKCEIGLSTVDIYEIARELLEKVDEKPVRLVGLRLYDLKQVEEVRKEETGEKMKQMLSFLSSRYRSDFSKEILKMDDMEKLHQLIGRMHEMRFG